MTKIYHGKIITIDSPLCNGETYINTDSTVWLLAGPSETCLRYYDQREAIVAVFYNDIWSPEAEVPNGTTNCRGDYFPIADDGTISGNIWTQYGNDVVQVEQFEETIISNCRTTNINNISIQDLAIELYPQPANDYLNIEIASELDFKISLFDLQGKEINDIIGHRLNTSNLKPGVYLLSFEYHRKRQIKKFVKM